MLRNRDSSLHVTVKKKKMKISETHLSFSGVGGETSRRRETFTDNSRSTTWTSCKPVVQKAGYFVGLALLKDDIFKARRYPRTIILLFFSLMTGFPPNHVANQTSLPHFRVSIQALLIDAEQSMLNYPLCLENAAPTD